MQYPGATLTHQTKLNCLIRWQQLAGRALPIDAENCSTFVTYTKPSCEIVAVRGPTGNPECAEMVASTVLGVSTHAWTSNVLTLSEFRRERSTQPFSVVVNVLNLTVKELEGANEWPVIVTLVATFRAAEVG